MAQALDIGTLQAKLKLDDASFKSSLESAKKEISATGKTSGMATSAISGLKGALGALGLAVSAAVVIRELKQQLIESVEAANKMQSALIGLYSIANAFGEDADEAKNAAVSLSEDGLMSVSESAAGLKNLLATGFSLDGATNLMNGFKDSAAFGRQGALGFGEAIVGATEGIKNQNSILVDNAGVTKNLSNILTEAGHSQQDLSKVTTDSSVRQALYNGLLVETGVFAGDAARVSETFAGAQSRLNVATFNLKATIGGLVQDAIKPTISAITDNIQKTNENISANDGLKAAAYRLGQQILILYQSFRILWSGIKNAASIAYAFVKAWFTAAKDITVAIFAIKDNFQALFDALKSGLSGDFSGAVDIFKNRITGAFSATMSSFDNLVEKTDNAGSDFVDTFFDAGNEIDKALGNIREGYSETESAIAEGGGAGGGLGGALGEASDAAEKFAAQAKSVFADIQRRVGEFAGAFDTLSKKTKAAFKTLKQDLKEIRTTFKENVKSIKADIDEETKAFNAANKERNQDLKQSIAQTIVDQKQQIKDLSADKVDEEKEAAEKILKIKGDLTDGIKDIEDDLAKDLSSLLEEQTEDRNELQERMQAFDVDSRGVLQEQLDELIGEQNQEVAELKSAAAEKKASIKTAAQERIAEIKSESAENIAIIQAEISSVQSLLNAAAADRKAVSAEIAEIERFNNLSPIEQLTERFAQDKAEATSAHQSKISELNTQVEEELEIRRRAARETRQAFKKAFNNIRKDAKQLTADLITEFGFIPAGVSGAISGFNTTAANTGIKAGVAPGMVLQVNVSGNTVQNDENLTNLIIQKTKEAINSSQEFNQLFGGL